MRRIVNMLTHYLDLPTILSFIIAGLAAIAIAIVWKWDKIKPKKRKSLIVGLGKDFDINIAYYDINSSYVQAILKNPGIPVDIKIYKPVTFQEVLPYLSSDELKQIQRGMSRAYYQHLLEMAIRRNIKYQ